MIIGLVGLGRMGSHMVTRLLGDNHDIVAFDLNKQARDEAQQQGA